MKKLLLLALMLLFINLVSAAVNYSNCIYYGADDTGSTTLFYPANTSLTDYSLTISAGSGSYTSSGHSGAAYNMSGTSIGNASIGFFNGYDYGFTCAWNYDMSEAASTFFINIGNRWNRIQTSYLIADWNVGTTIRGGWFTGELDVDRRGWVQRCLSAKEHNATHYIGAWYVDGSYTSQSTYYGKDLFNNANGVWLFEESDNTDQYTGVIDSILLCREENISDYVTQHYNNDTFYDVLFNNSGAGGGYSNSQPVSEIYYPYDGDNFTNQTSINMSLYGSDNYNSTLNTKLFVNGSGNITNNTFTNNTYWLYNTTWGYGTYSLLWQVCDTDSTPLCSNSSQINFTLYYDAPTVCSPNWTNITQGYDYTAWGAYYNNGSCNIDDTQNQSRTRYRWNVTLQYDNTTPVCDNTNTTFYHNNVTLSEHNKTVYCNNCSSTTYYMSWSNWTNVTGSCGNRTRNYWDSNYAACCAITGLPTDCIESDNQTWTGNYTDTQTNACAIGGDTVNTAIIIILPMLLGLFCVIAAATMGGKNKEHEALRIFLFLFSILTFFSSAHLAAVSGTIPNAMLDAIGDTVFWTGLLFGVIVIYYLAYLWVKGVQTAAQKKREKLEY